MLGKQDRNIFFKANSGPLVLPSYLIKIYGKSVKWFISYNRICKETTTHMFYIIEVPKILRTKLVFTEIQKKTSFSKIRYKISQN